MGNHHHIPRADGNTPEGALQNDLGNLVAQWQELGIDPDDFVRCGQCGEYTIDELGDDRMCACDRGELNVVDGVPAHGELLRVRTFSPDRDARIHGVLWNYDNANQPTPGLSMAEIKSDDGVVHVVKLWGRVD